MAQEGWQLRLTEVVAGEIRFYRKVRGMSGRALAERCAQLGLPIAQPVLAKLENGRRESISVAELIVIAQALNVPPTLLIVPVSQQAKMELLPGREADTGDALAWFAGERQFTVRSKTVSPTQIWYDTDDPSGVVHLYRLHDYLVGTLTPDDDPEEEKIRLEILGVGKVMNSALELREVRAYMRRHGLRLPDLPAGIAHLDDEAPDPEGEKGSE